MKKTIFLGGTILLFSLIINLKSAAQIYTPNSVVNQSLNNNIGIGNYGANASPISKFEILHDALYSDNFTAIHPFSIRNEFSYLNLGISNNPNIKSTYMQSYDISNGTIGSISLNPNGGKVGIGTFTPAQNFVVSNDNREGFEVFLNQPSDIVGLQAFDRSSGMYSNFEFDANRFVFKHGFLGIGTDIPVQPFVVSDNGSVGFEVFFDQLFGATGIQSFNRMNSSYTPLFIDASKFLFRNGNIGIGTMNPVQPFVVSDNGSVGFEVFLDQAFGATGIQSFNRMNSSYTPLFIDASKFLFRNGNVGIGTNNPVQDLVISNNGNEGIEVFVESGGQVGMQAYDRNINSYIPFHMDASNFYFTKGSNKKPTGVYSDAFVAIDGNMVCKKIQVQTSSWSDYVFDKNYKLMNLEEVEKFILENHHLPEIPNENRVITEGLDLGEMQKMHMQKIEELTLHLIEQNKKIIDLQNQLISIKSAIPSSFSNSKIKEGEK